VPATSAAAASARRRACATPRARIAAALTQAPCSTRAFGRNSGAFVWVRCGQAAASGAARTHYWQGPACVVARTRAALVLLRCRLARVHTSARWRSRAGAAYARRAGAARRRRCRAAQRRGVHTRASAGRQTTNAGNRCATLPPPLLRRAAAAAAAACDRAVAATPTNPRPHGRWSDDNGRTTDGVSLAAAAACVRAGRRMVTAWPRARAHLRR
jgi:hypothetical protein